MGNCCTFSHCASSRAGHQPWLSCPGLLGLAKSLTSPPSLLWKQFALRYDIVATQMSIILSTYYIFRNTYIEKDICIGLLLFTVIIQTSGGHCPFCFLCRSLSLLSILQALSSKSQESRSHAWSWFLIPKNQDPHAYNHWSALVHFRKCKFPIKNQLWSRSRM